MLPLLGVCVCVYVCECCAQLYVVLSATVFVAVRADYRRRRGDDNDDKSEVPDAPASGGSRRRRRPQSQSLFE